jgi:hypothetical protein
LSEAETAGYFCGGRDDDVSECPTDRPTARFDTADRARFDTDRRTDERTGNSYQVLRSTTTDLNFEFHLSHNG